LSKLYADPHRTLQDRFDTRRLADRLEAHIVHGEFTPEEKAFVEGRDMFFLSTIDPAGRPTVSYKGGVPGFVKVPEPGTLVFPLYDGNGMYYSAGNLAAHPEVGLLFIDLETPNRLRVQGKAELSEDPDWLALYKEAELLVRVAVEAIWVNCARYIHGYQKLGTSPYAPEVGKETPFATWKRVDIVQEWLPERDRQRAEEAGGPITGEEYRRRLAESST
jgi:hypothetical protein